MTENVTSFEFEIIMSLEKNQFYPTPLILPPKTRRYMHRTYEYIQLADFLGAHESSESKLGDIFGRYTLLFPSLPYIFFGF